MSWVLMSHNGGETKPIAASADIQRLIDAGREEEIAAVPDDHAPNGPYLFEGAFDEDLVEFFGVTKAIDWNDAQKWMARAGEEA